MKGKIFSELVEGFDTFTAGRRFPVEEPSDKRIGAMKGKLMFPEDFDAPMPNDMFNVFEGAQG